MLSPSQLTAAQAHLAAADPVMAKLIAHHGPCTLGLTERHAFHVLCASIIGQQLSAKAADTIQGRVALLLNCPASAFKPEYFQGITVEQLRAQGLSNAKGKWLLELASRSLDGRFNGEQLAQLPNAQLVAELDALPGIGLWTAEMMLIFAFDRLDVFSMGDVGLRRSANLLYGKRDKAGKVKPLTDKQTLAISKKWAPYRSVASWYLWRMIDGDLAAWA